MIADLLKDNLTRSLAAAFVSEEQIEAMVRPALEGYGLRADEIDALVAEARANVRAWKASTSVDVKGIVSAGSQGLLHALGIPTRNEIEELKQRLDELSARLGSATKERTKAPPRSRGARS